MKRFLVLAGVITAMALMPLNAQADCNCAQKERGYISVSATSEKELSPDTVEISISVQTEDTKSMQKAVAQNKETSDKIYTVLKSMITSADGDTIKTTNYSASPLYKYVNNKKSFDKYQVNNNIIVKTKSIDKIGSMIDKAIANGATQVNNLNFSVSNYDNEYNNLINCASKKAYSQANSMISAVSGTLDGVKNMSVNYSSSQMTNRVYYNAAPKMLMASGASDEAPVETASPIEPGKVKIKATVNASFYVK